MAAFEMDYFILGFSILWTTTYTSCSVYTSTNNTKDIHSTSRTQQPIDSIHSWTLWNDFFNLLLCFSIDALIRYYYFLNCVLMPVPICCTNALISSLPLAVWWHDARRHDIDTKPRFLCVSLEVSRRAMPSFSLASVFGSSVHPYKWPPTAFPTLLHTH